MLGLKLNHVSKRGHSAKEETPEDMDEIEQHYTAKNRSKPHT